MKKLLLAVFMGLGMQAMAQDSAQVKTITYQNYPSFPGFELRHTDSTAFNTHSIPKKNKQTVLIYFSPTCGHCQHQAEEITGHIGEFKNVNFLFVSAYPLEEIQKFAATYAMDKFKNITVAYDPESKMVRFLEIRSLPGIYIYDKKRKFKKAFSTNQLTADLVNALKS